jgi:hypothetical protein
MDGFQLVGALGATLVGGFFLLLGWGMRSTQRSRRRRGVITDGVVVGSQWQRFAAAGEPTTYAAPEVEFTDRDGETRRFLHQAGSTNVRPRTGRPVKVWYDPQRPDEVPVIHAEPVATAVPLALIGLGLLALGVGVLMLGALVLQ